MILEEAYQKLSKEFKPERINSVVELEDCCVFSVDDVDQPILVTQNQIRGLNGNLESDKNILNRVFRTR